MFTKLGHKLPALLQEDNVFSHAHHYQLEVFNICGIRRSFWLLTRQILRQLSSVDVDDERNKKRRKAFSTKKLAKDWGFNGWDNIEQERIQARIKRTQIYIPEIISLDGGSGYA